MCGGEGSRLKAGEKPLFVVCGKRLVDHSLEELADFEVVAVTSPKCPKTEKYLRSLGVEVYRARGSGFVEDYVEACRSLQIREPVLIVSADLVYIRRGLLKEVASFYASTRKPALCVLAGGKPVGINVVHAAMLDSAQEEDIFIISERDVVNVNTLDDARRAEALWMSTRSAGDGSWRG